MIMVALGGLYNYGSSLSDLKIRCGGGNYYALNFCCTL